jgi:hypothetical protein
MTNRVPFRLKFLNEMLYRVFQPNTAQNLYKSRNNLQMKVGLNSTEYLLTLIM